MENACQCFLLSITLPFILSIVSTKTRTSATTQNYYCRYGEIDIIAEENGYTVFIEVKYRKNTMSGSPESAVNGIKRKHIRQAALDFLINSYGTEEIPCRFDVVAITGNQINLIKDAF